jgi:hypothetical protein
VLTTIFTRINPMTIGTKDPAVTRFFRVSAATESTNSTLGVVDRWVGDCENI